MLPTSSLAALTNADLLDSLQALVSKGRAWEVELLRHLDEVERRDLHHAKSYSSMFVYCTDALGFEKAAAYNRIAVARLGRRFPRVLAMLEAGQLSLTAARTLGPHLKTETADDLLDAAVGKTVDEIKQLLAERAPKPAVPTSIRKTPQRRDRQPARSSTPLFDQVSEMSGERPKKPVPRAEPLAKDTYKVTFTGSSELVGMLEEVKTLLAQASGKSCDEAEAIETAVRELRDRLRKRKYAVGARPRKQKTAKKAEASESKGARRTRRIPNAVRRAVAERDGYQCAYVDPETGRRCCETRFLEFQHLEAFSRGGLHSVENLKLFCRGHNQFAARRDGLMGGVDERCGSPDRAVDAAAADGPVHSLWTAGRSIGVG